MPTPQELLEAQVSLLRDNQVVLTQIAKNQVASGQMLSSRIDVLMEASRNISRAATLYFWLTIAGLVFGFLIFILNISMVIGLLRFGSGSGMRPGVTVTTPVPYGVVAPTATRFK